MKPILINLAVHGLLLAGCYAAFPYVLRHWPGLTIPLVIAPLYSFITTMGILGVATWVERGESKSP